MPLLSSGIEVSIISGETEEELPALNIHTTSLKIPYYSLSPVDVVNATVPSVEGETFGIHVNNTIRKPVKYQVKIDDRIMDEAIIMSRSEFDINAMYTEEGAQNFMFSNLQVKDDDGEADGDSFPTVDLSTIGLIEIKFWRIKILRKARRKAGGRMPKVQASLDPISEKAKKVGGHGVKLGPVRQVPISDTATTITSEDIDPPFRPHAVFRYRYKPQDMLEREGITVPARANKRPHSDDEDDDEDEESNEEDDEEDSEEEDEEAGEEVEEVKPDIQAKASQASSSRKRARRS